MQWSHLQCHETSFLISIRKLFIQQHINVRRMSYKSTSIWGITVKCKKKKNVNKEGKGRASRLRIRNQNEISQIRREIQKHIWTSMKGFVNDARQSSVVTLAQGLALIEQWVENIKCVKWSQEKAGLVAAEIAHSFFTDPTLGRGGFALHPPLYTPLRPH